MSRRAGNLWVMWLLAFAATSFEGAAVTAGPQEDLNKSRRQLVETREALAALLGPERLAEVQVAQAEVTQLKPWVTFFEHLELSAKLDGSDTRPLKKVQADVRRAERALAGWRKDDAEKGQGDGPQTLQAAAELEAAQRRLRQFKSSLLDAEVTRVSSFAAQGIRSFDELQRRLDESKALLDAAKRESGPIGNHIRRIENLERGIATLEVKATGKAVFRLEYVLRRPRGYWEHSIPEHVKPNGGSWTRAEATRRSFRVQSHGVHHKDVEDWDFRFEVGGLESKVEVAADAGGQLLLDLDVSGTCGIGGNVPEERLSGGAARLDVRAGGAFSRLKMGAVVVGKDKRSVQETIRLRVNPGFAQATVHVFLWNIPVSVLCVYRRD